MNIMLNSKVFVIGFTLFLSGTLSAKADQIDTVQPETSSGGYWFNCGIRPSNRAVCWGSNTFGQLGDGNLFTISTTPGAPSGLGGKVAQVATGGYHSCALKENGRVFCWGYNARGQLGTGVAGGWETTPVQIDLPTRATAIAAGHEHTCAVLRNRTLACWGYNNEGQLGDGTTVTRASPTLVPGLSNVIAVSGSQRHTCALHRNQTVSCFGYNASGQVAATGNQREYSPVRVAGLRRVAEISVGWDHSCARQDNGNVQCWGNNLFGQLGRETVNTAPNAPGRVARLNDVKSLGVGRHQTCVADAAGRAFCWGDNSSGQLGNGEVGGDTALRSRVRGLGGSPVVAVHAGYDHSCALSQNGAMRCWGDNDYGQLGDGTTTDSPTPVRVSGRFLVPGDPDVSPARLAYVGVAE